MKSCLLLMLLAPTIIKAQVIKENALHIDTPATRDITIKRSGIAFTENLTWQQVRKIAKKENKYIFVDCYTTWCKPCKRMDINVYANDSVGNLFNDRFISVKVQMDTTKTDNKFTRKWYNRAQKMKTKYGISAYPTSLFFAPDGKIVHKDFGYKTPDKFKQTARNALNPSKQYYVLLKAYKKGEKDFVNMPYLITMAKQFGDTSYHQLLADYYAYLLTVEKLYTKENITFIASTLEISKQPLFYMFYPDQTKVDNVMKKEGYARNVVDRIIIKEKVNPFLRSLKGKSEPDWDLLYNIIVKDYNGGYADRLVLETQMKWHYVYGNILKYATVLNDKMEKYGSDTTNREEDFTLSNMAFIILNNIKDSTELKKIIGWMAGIVRRGEKATGLYTQYFPLYIDTYANLLYKVGEKLAALKWQEIAVARGIELAIDKADIKNMKENLEKMKKGEATWPEYRK